MHVLRRITAILLAVVMTASPALACAGFCGEASTPQGEAGSTRPSPAMMGTHYDCAEMAAESGAPKMAGHAGCMNSDDCTTAENLKNPIIAAAPFVSIDVPAQVFLPSLVAISEDSQVLARRHLTPPAIGPPPAVTPLNLKTILRI